MPLMNWSPELDVGVEAMNHEHRQILDAMNDVFDSDAAGVTGTAMMAKIARLGEVTTRHFADEERYMDRIAYPGRDGHKTIHAKLLSDFAKHSGAIEAADGKCTREFFQFLNLWLSAHIKHIDRKYGDHANSGGVKAA